MAKFDSYKSVSDYLLALANETGSYVSNLKLQKLMYYFQAWYCAAYDDTLFDEDFQAWVHGPVIPALYHKYKPFGYKPIVDENLGGDVVKDFRGQFSKDEGKFMSQVEKLYMSKSGYDLEKLSHREAPWIIARNGMPKDEPSEAVISIESMKEFYSQFISEED